MTTTPETQLAKATARYLGILHDLTPAHAATLRYRSAEAADFTGDTIRAMMAIRSLLDGLTTTAQLDHADQDLFKETSE